MTFSIVGYDPNTGDLGVAVQSKFICVGLVVPWAKAGVGAVATQAHANTTYGSNGLALLKSGLGVKEVVQKLTGPDDMREHRQVGVIDINGEADAFTGKNCFYWAGHIVGDNFACQGNIMISQDTVESMAKAFETSTGDLADKLLAVLHAADQDGRGDVRGKQSASLLVVRENGGYGEYTDRYIDIRVDEHVEPIKELDRIFQIYDMTFLAREDPSNLLTLEGEISENVKRMLAELNYISASDLSPGDQWTEVEHKAFEAWIGINNFENKQQGDNKLWKSVYNFIINEKGTPAVSLRQMSDI